MSFAVSSYFADFARFSFVPPSLGPVSKGQVASCVVASLALAAFCYIRRCACFFEDQMIGYSPNKRNLMFRAVSCIPLPFCTALVYAAPVTFLGHKVYGSIVVALLLFQMRASSPLATLLSPRCSKRRNFLRLLSSLGRIKDPAKHQALMLSLMQCPAFTFDEKLEMLSAAPPKKTSDFTDIFMEIAYLGRDGEQNGCFLNTFDPLLSKFSPSQQAIISRILHICYHHSLPSSLDFDNEDKKIVLATIARWFVLDERSWRQDDIQAVFTTVETFSDSSKSDSILRDLMHGFDTAQGALFSIKGMEKRNRPMFVKCFSAIEEKFTEKVVFGLLEKALIVDVSKWTSEEIQKENLSGEEHLDLMRLSIRMAKARIPLEKGNSFSICLTLLQHLINTQYAAILSVCSEKKEIVQEVREAYAEVCAERMLSEGIKKADHQAKKIDSFMEQMVEVAGEQKEDVAKLIGLVF